MLEIDQMKGGRYSREPRALIFQVSEVFRFESSSELCAAADRVFALPPFPS